MVYIARLALRLPSLGSVRSTSRGKPAGGWNHVSLNAFPRSARKECYALVSSDCRRRSGPDDCHGGLVAPIQAALAVPPPPEGGIPYPYIHKDYQWFGTDADCHLHMKADSLIAYKRVLWTEAIVIYDGIFAEGDWCKINPTYYFGQSGGRLTLRKFGMSGAVIWCMRWKDARASNSAYSYFQGFDGNLVSYNGNQPPGALGATDTCCITVNDVPDMPVLAIQQDGNVVIYRYNAVHQTYTALWATNTVHQ
jgi:hypothetical protein